METNRPSSSIPSTSDLPTVTLQIRPSSVFGGGTYKSVFENMHAPESSLAVDDLLGLNKENQAECAKPLAEPGSQILADFLSTSTTSCTPVELPEFDFGIPKWLPTSRSASVASKTISTRSSSTRPTLVQGPSIDELLGTVYDEASDVPIEDSDDDGDECSSNYTSEAEGRSSCSLDAEVQRTLEGVTLSNADTECSSTTPTPTPTNTVCYTHSSLSLSNRASSAVSSVTESGISTITSSSVPTSKYPTFSAEEIARETERVKIVHQLLMKRERKVTVDDLYHGIAEIYGKRGLQGPFMSVSALQTFIEDHSHLFKYYIIPSRLENRGFGYRDGILEIVRCVHRRKNARLGGCLISEVYNSLIAGGRLQIYQPWTAEPRNERIAIERQQQFRRFIKCDEPKERKSRFDDTYFYWREIGRAEGLMALLKHEHSSIFHFEAAPEKDFYITLKKAAYDVPSLWDKSCLPQSPHVGLDLCNDKGVYFDCSRVQTFLAKVVSVQQIYAKAIIQVGIFRGRSIYILGSHVGLQDTNLVEVLYLDSLVSIVANVTLNASNDFRAISVTPLPRLADFDHEKRKMRSMVDVEKVLMEDVFPAPAPSTSSAAIDLNPVDRNLFRRAIDSEREFINYTRNLIGGSLISGTGLEQRYLDKEPKLFPQFNEFCAFIEERPYLFSVSVHQDDWRIAIADAHHVETCRSFIEFMSKYPNGLAYGEIFKKLKGGEAGYTLQQVCIDSQLSDLLDSLKNIIKRVNLAYPPEEIYMLCGSYSSADRIFVPFFVRCFM